MSIRQRQTNYLPHGLVRVIGGFKTNGHRRYTHTIYLIRLKRDIHSYILAGYCCHATDTLQRGAKLVSLQVTMSNTDIS